MLSESLAQATSPLKQHTAQVRSPRMLFELFAGISFGILEGGRRRRTRSPVLTSLMTPLNACEYGMVRGCAVFGEPPILYNRMKEAQARGQPMLDVRPCGPPVS